MTRGEDLESDTVHYRLYLLILRQESILLGFLWSSLWQLTLSADGAVETTARVLTEGKKDFLLGRAKQG